MSKLTHEWKNLEAGSNPYAKPALVVGIISVFLFEFFIPPILAIILGALGMNRATNLENKNKELTGKVLSTWGLVLGLVYLVCAFYSRMVYR